MPQIKVLLWDIGGVLLSNAWDHNQRRATIEHFDLDWEEFSERHELVVSSFECGQITIEQYLDRTIFYRSRPFERQALKDHIFPLTQPNPDALDLARFTGAGQIGVSGSDVTFGGVVIGTIGATNDGANGAILTIALNANAIEESVQALIENLTYSTTNEAPAGTNRTIGIRVTDGDGGPGRRALRGVNQAGGAEFSHQRSALLSYVYPGAGPDQTGRRQDQPGPGSPGRKNC